MKRTLIMFSAIALLGGVSATHITSAQAFPTGVETAAWNNTPKSSAWAEELLGEVVTYQTLAEKNLIPGTFEAYVEQMRKVRELYRAGERRATYDGVNTLMVMLEARVGGIDTHSADALWDFCYRVTPDEFHARDRHVRAKGADTIQQQEQFIRDMEERASMSF